MTLRARFLSCAAAASITLAGCGSDSGEIRGAAVRDSAGIQIVEHPERAWADAPKWSVDPEPVLALGVVEGAPEYQFSRVTGALRLDDGGIVVADGASPEIRFFDAEGIHVRSVGRDGAGPGEYRVPRLIARLGADSLLVWDSALRRGSILGLDGTFVRTFPGPNLGGFVYFSAALRDGSLLGAFERGHRPNEMPTGVIRHSNLRLRLHLSGRIDTIGEFFSNEGYISGGWSTNRPLGRSAAMAASPERFHYGTSDSYEIRTYTLAGKLLRIVRSARSTPLEQSDIDALVARTSNPLVSRTFAEVPWPKTLPAYSEFRVDPHDNLWVGDFPRPTEDRRSWTIFGPDGALLGTLDMPPRFTVLEIGGDYILGSGRDELDVERILLYRLVRPHSR